MNTAVVVEKNSGVIERRSAYSICDVEWLPDKRAWSNLACVGAIHTRVTTKGNTSQEWRYYISSRALTARELLCFVRMEWSVESMHWLLDVHFAEDFCRVEDEHVQQNLNMVRKIALNSIRHFKNITSSKRPFSKIMPIASLTPPPSSPSFKLDFRAKKTKAPTKTA